MKSIDWAHKCAITFAFTSMVLVNWALGSAAQGEGAMVTAMFANFLWVVGMVNLFGWPVCLLFSFLIGGKQVDLGIDGAPLPSVFCLVWPVLCICACIVGMVAHLEGALYTQETSKAIGLVGGAGLITESFLLAFRMKRHVRRAAKFFS